MAVFMGIFALLALGLNIQWGRTGLFNAGVAGFFAVGAYTSAILTGPWAEGRLGGFELPVAAGWLGAMVVAGLIAWPIGKITLRLRSDYLAIATIGVAEIRSEEHTSELQSLMRISYAVFCLKKKKKPANLARETTNDTT